MGCHDHLEGDPADRRVAPPREKPIWGCRTGIRLYQNLEACLLIFLADRISSFTVGYRAARSQTVAASEGNKVVESAVGVLPVLSMDRWW